MNISNEKDNKEKNSPKKDQKKNLIVIIASTIFIALNILAFFLINPPSKPIEKTYKEFLTMAEAAQIKSVQIDIKNSAKFEFLDLEEKKYITDNPKSDNFKESLLLNGIAVEEIQKTKMAEYIMSFIQMALYFCVLLWVFKRVMPASKTEDFLSYDSSSKKGIPQTTFKDIAGQEELKKDLDNIIGYLKNPEKYLEIGARMQKGVILYGPPGTGKTLTAKAIAGTANVPFFSLSGSDFIEMYVGLGAKRVRSLFEKAKKAAPCIIFIDEIDAVGSRRGHSGNHSENDQTINALLKELDGFNGREGIITICATNRLEDLDPALIRPGRFDRQLAVPLPTREDREAIFKVHSTGKKVSDDIDYKALSAMTIGQSGAMIESIMNEAAISAIVSGDNQIHMNHVEQAFYKIIMKGNRQTSKRDEDELKIVAIHEAGHAIATKMCTDDSVPKVSVVSYTSGAGGATFRTPKRTGLVKKSYIESLIKVMYAGRAAEERFLGPDDITTGASSDIKMATELIKEYISAYGMNDETGLINTADFLGINANNSELLEIASSLSKKLYLEVKFLLNQNWSAVEAVSELLIKNETISEDELDTIMKLNGCDIYGETKVKLNGNKLETTCYNNSICTSGYSRIDSLNNDFNKG